MDKLIPVSLLKAKRTRSCSRFTLLLALTVAVGLPGCASVELLPDNPVSSLRVSRPAGHTERLALISASAELDRTPWPEVGDRSLSRRMTSILFGMDNDEEGLSRDEAMEVYAASLAGQSGDPVAALFADADMSLHAARDVAEAGRAAADAINPNTDDVAVLEQAIAQVRFSRDMYLATLRSLKSDGYEVSGQQFDDLKAAFSQTIEDIGSTADSVAGRAIVSSQAALVEAASGRN